MDFVEAPDFAGGGDVAGFGRVNAGEIADAFAVFRVLADGDINPVLVKDGRSIDFARAFSGGIFEFLAVGRIAIVFPDGFQKAAVAFLYRLGIEGVAPAVAAAEKDQFTATDGGEGGGTPLAMINSFADLRVVLAE